MTDEASDVSAAVPVFQKYMTPIVEVLGRANTPLTNDELERAVSERMQLSPDVLAELHDPENSDQPEAFYRMAWARTYLKKMRLINNPTRGAWELTDRGRQTSYIDPDEVVRQVRAGAEADQVSAEVPEHVAEELLGIYRNILAEGRLPQGDALAACYLRFRERFGPEILRRLDGDHLLSTIHGRGTKDSLVYWIEFKNDAEFPAVFGSIAGGSALKFGIYQTTDTREWMVGHPQSQRRVPPREALEIVRGQRDQLVAGTSVLNEFAAASGDVNYAALHEQLVSEAPDLANTAWGHKYFSLLFPNLLDDYHALDYQKFHLVKLHKLPSERRYENARLFAGIARQLLMPHSHLGATLNRRDGEPHTYWRLETSDDAGRSEWPRMRAGGFASIGWNEVGSLAGVERNKAGKDHVRKLLEDRLTGKSKVISKCANQLFHFATSADVADFVVAMRGDTVLGIGVVNGPYYYESDDGPFVHRLPVVWRSVSEWKLPKPEAPATTFTRLSRFPGNLVEVERRLAGAEMSHSSSVVPSQKPGLRSLPPPKALTGLIARIQGALLRKCQVILHGPPGTGKTYWAARAIHELAARSWHSVSYDDLSEVQRAALVTDGAVEHCCFHPDYGYEDFLVGYRPTTEKGALTYKLTHGIFARLCDRALARADRHFFLLIDEINRGDIPRIFGELLTGLEKDKRGKPMSVPLFDRPFTVPTNVFLIGTMNTADRSVGLLDAALRRRFAFIELMPDPAVLDTTSVGGLPLGAWLAELNRRIVRHAGRDARNLQVGHSYLLSGGAPVSDVARFAEILRDDILPLLQEYCYEDFNALEKMVGAKIVDPERQRVNDVLFLPAHRAELIDALLASFDEITATTAAASSDSASDVDVADLEEDESDESGT